MIKKFVIVSFVLTACTAHRFYNVPPEQRDGYRLSVIEFDDHGEIWQRNQLDAATQSIDSSNQHRDGAIVVAFVHGWKHIGRTDDANLRSFRTVLTTLANDEEGYAQRRRQHGDLTYVARPVVGIFLAWRGDSLALPEWLGKSFSYYDRDVAAKRVAGPAATEALYSLMAHTRRNPNAKIVICGHSMGALIVQRALMQALVASIFDQALPNATGTANRQLPADLIVLLNPAASAIESKEFVDMLKARHAQIAAGIHHEYVCSDSASGWRPLMIAITSEGDTATRNVFRFATLLDSLPQRFRPYAAAETARGLPSQRHVYIRPAAMINYLQSHELALDSSPTPMSNVNAAIQPCEPTYCLGTTSAGRVCFKVGSDHFVLSERANRFNDTPYWIISAPSGLIADHNDIFNDHVVNFLRSVVYLSDTISPEAKPYTLTAQ